VTVALKYWVDWTDPPYPEIRSDADASEHAELKTCAEAKRAVVERFQSQIDHARTVIAHTRRLRTSDVTSRAGENY
jgi:hypothetical protein